MSMFADHFWGEKHNGFEALSQNLKHGEQSCKDIEDFVKQCSNVEDLYVKSLTRLIRSIGSYNTSSSFSPVWQTVKTSFEKLSASHSELSKRWKELSNDIHKYWESLGKKYKTIKDGQVTTLETVQSMQSITTMLAKTKENYNTKFSDYKKVLSDKSTTKKLDRTESDFKKATEEYKLNVGKYNATLEEYKKRMSETTELFQENEVEYLSSLDQFVRKFTSIRDDKHTEIGELHYEFHSSLTELSVECLLDTFIETKGTGTEPPEPVLFEEADLASLPPPPSPEEGGIADLQSETPSAAQTTSSMMHLNITGIFRRKKKKKNVDNGKDADADSIDKDSITDQPKVDEEGFSVIPVQSPKDDSWESSSESGSDTEEKRHSKLKVMIKPLGAGSPSVNSSDGLRISTPSLIKPTEQTASPEVVDLLGSFSPKDSGSRGTTPISWANVPSTETQLTEEDREVFDTWKTNNTNSNCHPTPSLVIPGLPRPPSRKDIASNNTGRISAGRYSPLSGMLTKNYDAFPQSNVQTFSANQNSVDTIPIAIALTENIKSKIRGAEHESQVDGEVMISFPAEILSKGSLPKLTFRIAGRSPDQVQVHSQLISSDGDQHSFNESTLLEYLKKKQAQEPHLKHFNLEIARYTLNVTSLPLIPVAYWKCEPDTTDLRLEYEYVGSALSKPLPLTQVQFIVPVNGGVSNVQSMPEGVWSPPHEKILWRLPELKTGAGSKGNLKARFSLNKGPSTPSSVAIQFLCDGTILSGTEFEVVSKQYRISLTKQRMIAKFLVDTDKLVTYV
ncbi:F-BAR domain only protein 2-like isoform X2 [Watersipora subatra]|uniref:F-BAR domain only protein 2-like isoform X2 n=1 Tax=Watersipora subatra TaxID=2589382 RepID=UPI00355C6986